MSIREICNRNVVCATSAMTAIEAAQLMRQHHIGNVVVVDQQDGERTPLGVVTDRDIVIEVVAAGLDPKTLKLGDMSPPGRPKGEYRTALREGSPLRPPSPPERAARR